MKKYKNNSIIAKNSIVDEGDGVVSFPSGVIITDDSVMKNGMRYDIPSLDISKYKGQITIDHAMSVKSIVGKVFGLSKKSNKVKIKGIKFSVGISPDAILAYNLVKNNDVTDLSIETIGDYPDGEDTYFNHSLVGLSLVTVGNNDNATINAIVKNSIEEAEGLGLDTSELKEKYMEKEKKEDTAKVINDAVISAVNALVNPMVEQIKGLEQKILDNSAKEPEFTKSKETPAILKNKYSDMNYLERHGKQISHAWNALKGGSSSAMKELQNINEVNLQALQEKGIVRNSLTLADFGNFVISPELLSDIEGHRSDFSGLLDKSEWKETLSTQMSFLRRSGDIEMSEVELCDDGLDGNLKPVDEYSASIVTKDLHELAAVTPVCNAATRFAAVDILGDVAAGYRNDYDRKRAQLIIALMQQAVNTTGNVATYSTTSDTNALKSWVDTIASVSEEIMSGVWIMSHKSRWELVKRVIGAGISGPLASAVQSGNLEPVLGAPVIIVPNELMPTLNTAETKSFTVNGTAVTINRAIFYADLSTFTGRTSGGLQYDLSTDASYEVNGTVYSAFQRNELVLRGSFFRNGAIKNENKIAALGAPGIS